jgi:hypothetical protein
MKKIVDNTRKIFYLSLAMFPHPFITTEAELNEYTEAMEAFADAADQLPDPEPSDDYWDEVLEYERQREEAQDR